MIKHNNRVLKQRRSESIKSGKANRCVSVFAKKGLLSST